MLAERFKAIDWSQLQARHQALAAQLTAGINDQQVRSERQRELTNLTELLESYKAYYGFITEQAAVQLQLQQTTDTALAELFHEELSQLAIKITQAEAE